MVKKGHAFQESSPHALMRRKPVSYLQPIFIITGVLLTLSVFLILKSFIQDMINDEHSRMMQTLVEGVVEDMEELGAPLNNLSNLIEISNVSNSEPLSRILLEDDVIQNVYSHVYWFYKKPNDTWSYANLLKNIPAADAPEFIPDGEMLGQLLRLGVEGFQDPLIVYDLKGLDVKEQRQTPLIKSGFFALAQPIDNKAGFLLGVINPASLYDDAWIRNNRILKSLVIRDLKANRIIFAFDRNNSARENNAVYMPQIYEFPVLNKQWELSGQFLRDTQTKFLELFPFVFAGLGVFLVGAGAFYLQHSDKQARMMTQLNEVLEQKNFELKGEVGERERLNQALRDAEAENRAVIDSIGDVIFEINREGQFVFLNKAWEKMTGFEVEQSLGQELFQMTHPQDQAQQRQDFKTLLKGQKLDFRAYSQLRTSDGTFTAVEILLSVIQNDSRKGVRFIGTFTDIEERRRVERALSEAEKKYRNIVENAAGGIYQLTPEGLFLSANMSFARILGYESPENVLREIKNANERIFIDADKRVMFYSDLTKQDTIHNHETQLRTKDGSVIWVNENARAVKDETGQILYIEGSIEDITKRKQSDAAIREAKIHSDMANRAKSEFLANMSHELRTPLNSIIGFSEMIYKEVFGPISQSSYKEYANDIFKSGHKLLQVINEILDISKIEAGERQLNEAVINMQEVTDAALEILGVKIKDARLTVSCSFERMPNVLGEELALKQVVLNLLSNAVKFTPEGGRITISSHVGKNGRFHFSITDTGVGLDNNEIQKALSPFGQIESQLNRSGSGTGLGLTLVDALVKLHGGDFELFSQKGLGTTATIILPASRVMKGTENSQPKIIV